MNFRGSNSMRLAARWSNSRGTAARPFGSKSCDSVPIVLNSGLLPRKKAIASPFAASRRLLSSPAPSASPIDASSLPEYLKGLPQPGLRAALQFSGEGYVLLAPKAKRAHEFYRFGSFFLRENCQCPKCVHPETKQRIIEIGSVPSNITPTKIHCGTTQEGAQITWNDGHESVYTWDWLKQHKVVENPRNSNLKVVENCKPRPHRTFNSRRGDSYPEVHFEKVMLDDNSVGDWLENIHNYGFCFVKGVPIDPKATQSLIERIAFVRHTHYGGFWDFTADLTFKDTAYTNESLGVHTDNTYFTDPARLQLFHLLSHTDGSGGESLLVDGFGAAAALLKKHPEHYKTLVEVRHPWHASGNEDVCIQPSFMTPVFSLHPDSGRLYQIRWNNYDRAPKTEWSLKTQTRWYEAAQCYDRILNESRRKIQTQLQPGTALIFDNWRMMHGRTEFTGKRRMCGGYVNNDDYISRLRLLKFGREKVLNGLGNHGHRYRNETPYHFI